MRGIAIRSLLVFALFAGASHALGVTPRSDAEIRANVELRLQGNAELGARSIRVSVEDGVATLQGRVRLLSEAWKAERIAGEVRGLTGIENRLAVDATGRSNDEMRALLKRHFEDRVELASGDVAIAVEAGHVVLSGTVKDARVRFTARDAAAEVPGVLSVEDRIESPPALDEAILESVKSLLRPTSLVGVRGDIRPSVQDGVVTLDGMVLVLSSRMAAERVVLGINGVKKVVNNLTVRVKRPPGEG
jgi:osmotically-inducible protein OsmY